MTIDKYSYLLKNKDFASPKAERHHPPAMQLEPVHQIIKLNFDIEKSTAEGSITTIIKANVDGGNRIVFNAIDLEIHKISGPDSWNYNGKNIELCWTKPFEKEEKREVIIVYKCVEPVSGLYFSYPDEKYPNRPTYLATDHESERARYWLPCVDHTAIRCSIDFHLTAKNTYTILANGELVKEDENNNGTKTAYWKQEFPCPAYLLTIAIGEFIEYKDKAANAGKGEIPISYFSTNQYAPEDLKRAFDRTPKMLEWMWNKFKTPLEWPKYFQIATAKHSGAMENISFVTWNDFAVLDEIKYKESWWLLDAINVHEMAHSWFGDMIVCREFSHNWLKESWAVYVETVYYEDIYGENESLYDLYLNAKTYMNESDNRYARPIVTNKYDSSWDMFDAHLYPGGAWRIHMLRYIVGDEFFWNAVIDYLQTFKGKTVETIDFQRKLEAHSGLSLEGFFEQWIYSPGYPKLKASFKYDDKSKLCSVKIEQTQIDEKENIGIFKFPLDIMWEYDEGLFEKTTFTVEENEHLFYFRSEKKPKQVRIDPEYKILKSLDFNPDDDMLIRQLETGNVIDKIHAAEELAKKGKKRGIEAITKSYENEDFWGVKNAFAKALANSPNFEAIESLVKLLEIENDPLVLSNIIGNMRNLRYDIINESMKKHLERTDLLYYATATALDVIGSQRTNDSFTFLMNYEIKRDFADIIQSGLYRAIGKTRTKEALEYLIDKAVYGSVPEKARSGVIQGLIEIALWADKSSKERIIDKLSDVLRQEKDESTAKMIIRELSKLKETSTISTVESVKVKIAQQDHPMIDRIVKKIKKGKTTEEETKKLREELDETKSDMKKLLSRVEELEAKSKNR